VKDVAGGSVVPQREFPQREPPQREAAPREFPQREHPQREHPHRKKEAENGKEARASADDAQEDIRWAWVPSKRAYGVLRLLIAKEVIAEELAKPPPKNALKALDTRLVSPMMKPARPAMPQPMPDLGEDSDSDASYISEGEPVEQCELVSWGKGSRGAWWRVRASLREDLVIRGGVSLSSAEIGRTSPGDALQQKGGPRVLTSGRAQGCIRMPIQPHGWVTADASRVGGPQYLIRCHAPRWRAVYQSPNGDADAIIRAGPELDSEAVLSLAAGDVVEQAGPVMERPDGINRMPVTTVGRAKGVNDREDEDHGAAGGGVVAKTCGWVTTDAVAAGGPVYFKLVPDADGPAKQRRGGRHTTS